MDGRAYEESTPVQKARDEDLVEHSDLLLLERKETYMSTYTSISYERRLAIIALEAYEKEFLDAKFEILEVLFSNRALVYVPGFGDDRRLWCHVCFIAKPRNADCKDESIKHIFGEMVFDPAARKYDVTLCSSFELSDPGNVDGCVFCPTDLKFLHPADGCPARGREIGKYMGQKGMDASQGQTGESSQDKVKFLKGKEDISRRQMGGCSVRHPMMSYLVSFDDKSIEKYLETLKLLRRECVKILLEFYEMSHDGEFEIVEVLFEERHPALFSKRKRVGEWCHLCFSAKPRNASDSQHFFGELFLDDTTGIYSATFCKTFKYEIVENKCGKQLICPPTEHFPSNLYSVYTPEEYSDLEKNNSVYG